VIYCFHFKLILIVRLFIDTNFQLLKSLCIDVR